jgi:hypothetical protein
MAGNDGMKAMFFLKDPPPEGAPESGIFYWTPDPAPSMPAAPEGGMPGAALFLSRSEGWAVAAGGGPREGLEALDAWAGIKGLQALPEGAILVWAAAPDVPAALEAVLSLLPPAESSLCSSGSWAAIDACARSLAQSRRAYLYPHLEAPGALLPRSLLSVRLKEREDKERLRAGLEREAETSRRDEDTLQEEISVHRTLRTLEANLESLRAEISQRKGSWFASEYARAEALVAWEAARTELVRGRGAVRSFFSGKAAREALESAEREAAARLGLAERTSGTARREREDFVREAKALKDELLDARDRAGRLRPLAEAEAALAAVRRSSAELREKSSRLAREAAAAPLKPPGAMDLEQSRLILAREGTDPACLHVFARHFDNVIALAPKLAGHRDREALAARSAWARKRFIVIADFTLLAWQEEPPKAEDGTPGWYTFMASEPLPLKASLSAAAGSPHPAAPSVPATARAPKPGTAPPSPGTDAASPEAVPPETREPSPEAVAKVADADAPEDAEASADARIPEDAEAGGKPRVPLPGKDGASAGGAAESGETEESGAAGEGSDSEKASSERGRPPSDIKAESGEAATEADPPEPGTADISPPAARPMRAVTPVPPKISGKVPFAGMPAAPESPHASGPAPSSGGTAKAVPDRASEDPASLGDASAPPDKASGDPAYLDMSALSAAEATALALQTAGDGPLRASSAIAAALAALRESTAKAPSRHEPPPNPLGAYPAFRRQDDGSTMRPSPASFPGLLSLNVQDGLAICPLSLPETFSLRRRGEEGPVNMATAYAATRLAAAFLEGETASRPAVASGAARGEKTAAILCPSPAQAALCRALIEDFGKAGARVLAGEPGDFEGFPRQALVILDTALGAPHGSHPWARGSYGAKSLLQALALSGGALVLLGPEKRLAALPADGPLGRLYRASADKVHADLKAPLSDGPFQDALEKARESVFLALPPMGGDWWRGAALSFQGALRRKVRLTLFSAPPAETGAGQAASEDSLRALRVSGAQVLLADGFPGFAATVDRSRFFWGEPGGVGPASKGWKTVCSFRAPRAASLLEEVLQLPLVEKKLGPGRFRSCPLCGWPFLLVNRKRPRGFGDANPLKLGCMNPACPDSRDPRPLDERWPYASPPLCLMDGNTPYERARSGKKEFWVCPNHPDGDICPRSRTVPGDPPGKKP